MRKFHIPRLGSLRIWGCTSPPIICLGEPFELVTLGSKGDALPMKTVTLEWFAPAGGRYFYGLLGAQLLPAVSDHLTVLISAKASHEAQFKSSLMDVALDVPLVGLPTEYFGAVGEGFQLASETMLSIASGVLKVHCAAYSDVGSSHFVFRRLAAVLMRLIHLPDIKLTEEEIISLWSQHS